MIGSPMILGIDFSGTVVAAGPDLHGYRVGDDVMGALRLWGADAEYIVVRPGDRRTAVAHKPPSISHAEAAAASFAGLIALAGMTTHGGLSRKPGARVLVIGASGGVGHLAVQIAKRGMGAAFVAGVCSSRNEAFVRACGADAVVAYDRTPIGAIPREHPEWLDSFDLILDAVGIDQAWTILAPRLLAPTGRFVGAAVPPSAEGKAGEDVGILQGLSVYARFMRRRMGGRFRFIYGLVGNVFRNPAFPRFVQWLADGKVVVQVAATYPLDRLAEAHRASESGRTVGKIAVIIP
jgi:NADPH:quinone reductase-like Zn-dependent oxidoreductase